MGFRFIFILIGMMACALGQLPMGVTPQVDESNSIFNQSNNSQYDDLYMPILIFFYAEWSGPSRLQLPILEALEEEFTNVKIRKINVDSESEREFVEHYGISVVPTTILEINGRESKRWTGLVSPEELEKTLNKTLNDNQTFQNKTPGGDMPDLIFFGADWCGPCRMQLPVLEALEDEFINVEIRRINVDSDSESERELVENYGIFVVPTTILEINGRESKRWIGLVSPEELKKTLNKTLNDNQTFQN